MLGQDEQIQSKIEDVTLISILQETFQDKGLLEAALRGTIKMPKCVALGGFRVFHDRRSKNPLARRIFLSVWLIVATIYLIGIAVIGTVLYANMEALADSPFNMKLKLFLVGLGFIACIHGALSPYYLFWKEIPHLIAAIEEDGKRVKITTMNGHHTVHAKDDVICLVEQTFGGVTWYTPYSLTIGKGKKYRMLQADTRQFAHDRNGNIVERVKGSGQGVKS